MVFGLVPEEEEERIFKRLIEYYGNIYPGISFKRKDVLLTHEQVSDILYTYSGEETEATAKDKMRLISSAIKKGYATPVILLEKDGGMILLDGHRRVRVAFAEGLGWPAIVMVPSKNVKFGIEDMVMARVGDLYG